MSAPHIAHAHPPQAVRVPARNGAATPARSPARRASAAVWSTLDTRRLRILTILAPLAFLGLVDLLRHTLFYSWLHPLIGSMLIGLVLAVAVTLFSNAIFGALERLQSTVLNQSRRMAALEEHDRMAREINDGFLQRMYGIGLSLQSCLLDADRLPPGTAEQLERTILEMDEAITAMREHLMAGPDA